MIIFLKESELEFWISCLFVCLLVFFVKMRCFAVCMLLIVTLCPDTYGKYVKITEFFACMSYVFGVLGHEVGAILAHMQNMKTFINHFERLSILRNCRFKIT